MTELFYSHILDITEVPFKQEVSGVYTSPFLDTDELTNQLYGPEKVSGLSKHHFYCVQMFFTAYVGVV